ncbi:sugar ABC transporter ATP-binding protein [Microbacterium sp. QXD-8]|uniref:Sugar ABC transporter ATP-binding protein n=1 Tax=Microbacterium psychrotolerans TaxID=3068321 RepID=A0ABU0YY85_9MICO|nr:sugar ABC transporter ATP-binding protein [Microbacterium sp. QXD-8]MDQ7876506.1 sugar ABC transporter ATP-binding protein [Microbacterium sp. QXD-8]
MNVHASSIDVRSVTKIFGSQRALSDVSVTFHGGEVHALAGLNGSGKSTLVKLLAGVYSLDAGEIAIDGETVPDLNPVSAGEFGLQFLHQDPVVFSNLTVADNVSIGSRYRSSSPARVHRRQEQDVARDVFERLGVAHLDPVTPMADLSPAERTMVAIARAVQDLWNDRGVRLLVLDEPTASLPEHEVTLVTDMVRRVAAEGVAVLFITHDLDMVLELADRVTVLRDGELVQTSPTSDMTKESLASSMVGGAETSVVRDVTRIPRAEQPVSFTADAISGGSVAGVSLAVRRGEIVGIAGLLGSGRSTLLRLLYGAQSRRSGVVELDGGVLKQASPRHARKAGIGFVPEDRRRHGALPAMTMADNVTIASMGGFASPLWIRRSRERQSAADTMEQFDVRPRDPDKSFRLFSGGNQQKAIIGRWARISPKVLLLDEPTQGVDVHARVQIHDAIRRLAGGGMSVLVVSSDFGELLGLCDRVLVMRRGRIRGQVDPSVTPEEQLLHMAASDDA